MKKLILILGVVLLSGCLRNMFDGLDFSSAYSNALQDAFPMGGHKSDNNTSWHPPLVAPEREPKKNPKQILYLGLGRYKLIEEDHPSYIPRTEPKEKKED